MRVFTCCLLVVVTTAALAPTSEDLHTIYGASTNLGPRRDGTPVFFRGLLTLSEY